MDRGRPVNGEEIRKEGRSLWPKTILGPAPGLREINLAAWGLFLGLVVVPFLSPIVIGIRAGRGISEMLPVDFIYFYGIGRLVDAYSVSRLYDYSLQLQVFNQIFPLHDGAYGPSPYPPLVALFFGLLSHLSLLQAYLVWMVISLCLYLAGVRAAIKAVVTRKRLEVSLIYCAAMAFFPFFISNIANGQLASVAVFAAGLGVSLERRSKPFASGLMLSLLAYKPTLLLLLLPMLLLTRRLRTLAGFVAGTACLLVLSTALAGVGIWPSYLAFLRSFSQSAGPNSETVLLRWKYVDLTSLSFALPGGRSHVGELVLVLAAVGVGLWLAVTLWKSARAGRAAQTLAWATTLTWTLILNIYVPIYDSVLLAVALILVLGSLRELGWREAERRMTLAAVSTFAISWVTLAFARNYGLQLLTIALVILGLFELGLLRRAIIANPFKIDESRSEGS